MISGSTRVTRAVRMGSKVCSNSQVARRSRAVNAPRPVQIRTNRTENTPLGFLVGFVLCCVDVVKLIETYVGSSMCQCLGFGIDSVKVVLFMSGDIIIINMARPCCMCLYSASESRSETSTGASESPLGPSCIE